MGKRIIPRARGKGGPRYRVPSHRYLGRVEYLPITSVSGTVKDILHDPARTAPLALIKLENGKEVLHIATEGLRAGDIVSYDGSPGAGNVLSLLRIPEGTRICGIEVFPGSGPKLCRSSGTFATVVGKFGDRIRVMFPSGKIKELNAGCRAMIGVPAGGGRLEKPFVKAGNRFFYRTAKGKLYPRVKGVSMSPVDHPYGGKSKRPRPSRTVSRDTPPGAKVGSIAARRTGIRKGK
jgi:large subunit ribosomal protein L2